MSVRDVVLRRYAAFNARDLTAYGATLADDVAVTVELGTMVGRDEVLRYTAEVFAEFPGMVLEVVDTVAEGPDTLLVEIRMDNRGPAPSPDHRDPDAVANEIPKTTFQLHRVEDGVITAIRSRYGARIEDPISSTGVPPALHASRILEEQRALHRVAALVASGAPPDDVFATVTSEASQLHGGASTSLLRLTSEGLEVVARREGPQLAGIRQTLSASITVEGRPWGELRLETFGLQAPETRHRLEQFADLVAAAIANAEAAAALRASRARLIASTDEARRRLQRDVHDGAQQRLVQTLLTLSMAEQVITSGSGDGLELLRTASLHAQQAVDALRDLAAGILPRALAKRGLTAALDALARDSPLPVEVDVEVPRLPEAVETTAYFVAAEALTNVVKHAGATRAGVRARVAGGRLEIEVRDDGRGTAEPGRGSGLTGLMDRVEALDGRFAVTSAPDQGTVVAAVIPVAGAT